MKLLSTVALAAAAGAARAAAHDAHVRQLVLSLRETATHAIERRGLQDGADILAPCLDALGIPEAVYECFLGDLDSETDSAGSTGTEDLSDALSNLAEDPAGATPETCQEAFEPRSAQCTVFIARMDNATDVLDQIASSFFSNLSSNFTALPAQCQPLAVYIEPLVEEDSTQGSTEDSLAQVGTETIVTALTAAGDACEALVPGVTTSKLNAEPTSAPTVPSDTGDDDDDDSTNEPTRAPTPSSGDDDDDDSTKEPTRAPTPSSGDDDDDDDVTTTATPTTSPTAASSASTDRVAVAAGVLAALLVR